MGGEVRKSGDREYIALNKWVNSFRRSRHNQSCWALVRLEFPAGIFRDRHRHSAHPPLAGPRSLLYLHRKCTTVSITPLCGCLKRKFVLHTLDVIRSAQPPPPNVADDTCPARSSGHRRAYWRSGELIQRNIQTNHNSNNRAANGLTPHGTTHCTMLKVQANVSLKWT
jgi:hypothetical protein